MDTIQKNTVKGVRVATLESNQGKTFLKKGNISLSPNATVESHVDNKRKRLGGRWKSIQEDEKIEWYEQYLSGKLSKEAFLKANSQIAVEAETAKAQYTIAESRLAQLIEQLRTQEHQISNGQRYTEHAKANQLDRQLLQLLVKQITVFPEGRIRIIWNFSDELSEIMKAMPENGPSIAVQCITQVRTA